MIKLICDSCGCEIESSLTDALWPLSSKNISVIISSDRRKSEPIQRSEINIRAELCDNCIKKLQYVYDKASDMAIDMIKKELNLQNEQEIKYDQTTL